MRNNYYKEFLQANGLLSKFNTWKTEQVAKNRYDKIKDQVKFYHLDFDLENASVVITFDRADQYPTGDHICYKDNNWSFGSKSTAQSMSKVKTAHGDCYPMQDALRKLKFLPVDTTHKEYRR